ncbi:hypothetical protein SeLEV6574_g02879 [Synchytrium endobioticum]|uniref:Uncharacterized protein n=1 Tax=Synchytrium endobioticum TaxID=286115 RepID=A0A507D682_9FUNG|nr:hypothetical protein SeLEV6574_g02879 [Synchytrium endobioticum]
MARASHNNTVLVQEPMPLTANTITTVASPSASLLLSPSQVCLVETSIAPLSQDGPAAKKRTGTVAIATVQGAGIYIYDLATQLPIYSYNASPDTRFATAAQMSAPLVYVAVQSSPVMDAKLSKRVIWAWDTTIVAMQTPLTISVDHPIQSLHTICINDHCTAILVIHTNHYMTIYSHDLQRKLATYTPTTSTADASIVYTSPKWMLVKTSDSMLNVYAIEILSVAALYDIKVTCIGDVHLESNLLALAMDSEPKLIVALASGVIQVYRISGGIVPVVTISLQYLQLVLKPGHIDLIAMDEHHIAVTASRPSSTQSSAQEYQGLLLIWDTKYGVLQMEKTLSHLECSRRQSPIQYCVTATNSPLTGPSLLVACSSSSSKASFETDLHLFPCRSNGSSPADKSPLGVLVVNNTLSKPVAVSSNGSPPSASEERLIAKLMDPSEAPDEGTFQKVFVSLILARLGKDIKPQIAKQGHDVSLASLPRTDLAQPTMLLLLTRCLSSYTSFFPHIVIHYLLRLGAASSRSIPGGIVRPLLEKADMKLLRMALLKVVDLSESEIVDALMFVCGASTNKAWVEKESRIQMMDAMAEVWQSKNKKRTGNNKVTSNTLQPQVRMDVDEYTSSSNASNASKLSKGQADFLELIFSAPRTRDVFQRCLRAVGIAELEVLLNWILACIKDSEAIVAADGPNNNINDNALWWLWKGRSATFLLAVEALTLLLDSHVFNMILTEPLHGTVHELAVYLSTSISTYALCQSRLGGPLRVYKPPSDKPAATPTLLKKGGDKWAKLMEDVNDGVGMYSIEYLTI